MAAKPVFWSRAPSQSQSRAGWIVCGEARDGKEALEKAIQLKPDVILVDVSMPHLNGFEAARCIHEQVPSSEILQNRAQAASDQFAVICN